MRIRPSRSPATAIALVALFVALGGTGYAALPKGSDRARAVTGDGTIYHESFDLKTIGPDVSKPGPPITIPDVGQFTFTCVNSTGVGAVSLGVTYKNSTGGNQQVFISQLGNGGSSEVESNGTVPGHTPTDIASFVGTNRYTVQVLGASRLINLTGAVVTGQGCRSAAQAVFTN